MMARRHSKPPRWPLLASIGLHLLLIVGLIWANFRQPPPSEELPAAVELWTSAPPPPPSEAVKAAPAPVVKPEPAPEPTPPVDTRDAEIKLGKQEPKPHKREEPKPQPEVKPKPVPKPVEPPPPPPEKKPVEKKPAPAPEKPKEKPKPAPVEPPKQAAKAKEHPSGKGTKTAPHYNNEADDMLSALDSTNTTRKGNAKIDQAGGQNGVAGGSAAGKGVNLNGYKAQVVARIRPLVRVPEGLDGNPAVEVRVRVLPDMSVNSVELVKSSGNSAYDEAVQRAIRESGNFPPRPAGADPSQFRTFNLIFRPR